MKKIVRLAALFILLIAAGFMAAAPLNPQAQETESTVPQLVAFHDIIYPIWHTSYPEKNYADLRSYVPQIKSLAEKLYAAPLPGILRDKEAKWKQGLAELRKAVDDYAAAASGTEDEALLQAAEVLHAKYEMLVRITRPILKEMDDFHKVLYVVYHKDLPNKDYGKIKAAAPELMTKAEAIMKATLPARLESRKEQFRAAASALYESAKALAVTVETQTGEPVDAAVENVHAKYQDLVRVFD
jgi:predicted lipoprotein